jgi:hypothetical protein
MRILGGNTQHKKQVGPWRDAEADHRRRQSVCSLAPGRRRSHQPSRVPSRSRHRHATAPAYPGGQINTATWSARPPAALTVPASWGLGAGGWSSTRSTQQPAARQHPNQRAMPCLLLTAHPPPPPCGRRVFPDRRSVHGVCLHSIYDDSRRRRYVWRRANPYIYGPSVCFQLSFFASMAVVWPNPDQTDPLETCVEIERFHVCMYES